MGWMTGLEPATTGSTIRGSNQLSYIHREVGMLRRTRVSVNRPTSELTYRALSQDSWPIGLFLTRRSYA